MCTARTIFFPLSYTLSSIYIRTSLSVHHRPVRSTSSMSLFFSNLSMVWTTASHFPDLAAFWSTNRTTRRLMMWPIASFSLQLFFFANLKLYLWKTKYNSDVQVFPFNGLKHTSRISRVTGCNSLKILSGDIYKNYFAFLFLFPMKTGHLFLKKIYY